MTPLSFITDAADNDYNTPAGAIIEALSKPVIILSSSQQTWEILSYYYDHKTGQMCLDIQEVEQR